jgi:diaminohydroxyphosphoribosylaminopyrimidine deaminase/5-amino-6-(5-phosphoribosylamino)uracil reductase
MNFMECAADAGERARYHAPPNPWVGCVIVKNDKIVGEGFTQPPGQHHAEITALQKAGEEAKGSTVYVTLEPCAHFGRTPPCSQALIRAGVAKVCVALQDPDPKVAGKGISELRHAGIVVEVGLAAERVKKSLAPYLHHRTTGLPWCVAKAAISIDGRMTAVDGSSKWITCEHARKDVHELRAQSQAIIIGAETALKDRPQLTVRDFHAEGMRQPLRIILDSQGRVPREGPLFDPDLAETLVITGKQPLKQILSDLGRRGILQVLIEGGPKVLTSFWKENLINQLVVYMGPRLLGSSGKALFDLEIPNIELSPRLELLDSKILGSSVRTSYRQP